jgi:hypothetical protein
MRECDHCSLIDPDDDHVCAEIKPERGRPVGIDSWNAAIEAVAKECEAQKNYLLKQFEKSDEENYAMCADELDRILERIRALKKT